MERFRPWLELIALAFSPLIAVQVSAWIQRATEKRNRKLWVLSTLLATRHSIFADERLRAINSVEFYFHDDPQVRHLFREYMTMLGNEGLDNPQGYAERDRKLFELINEMAQSLGFGKTFTALDYQRGYAPRYLVQGIEQSKKVQDLFESMLGFFNKVQAGMDQAGAAAQPAATPAESAHVAPATSDS